MSNYLDNSRRHFSSPKAADTNATTAGSRRGAGGAGGGVQASDGANYIESTAVIVVSASGMAFSPHPVSAPSLFFTSAIIHTPRIMRLFLANRILIYDPIHIRWGILCSLTIGCSDSLAGLKLYHEPLHHRPSPIPAQGRLQGWGAPPHPSALPRRTPT